MLTADQIQRVLVVNAHPDDVDFGSAGTVATLTDAGVDVAYLIVTDGDAGGFDPSVPRSAIGGIRRAEQTRAAKEVGVEELHFLGYPDGRVEVTLDLRRDISRVIRTVNPDVVICPNPTRDLTSVYRSHPDHTAVGEATMCAVYPDARNDFTFVELAAEGLAAWSVSEVWVVGSPIHDYVVDVTDQVDRKLRALLSHESQHQDPSRLEPLIREWMAGTAKTFELSRR